MRHKANDGVVYAIRTWFKYDTALSAVVEARTAYSFIHPSSAVSCAYVNGSVRRVQRPAADDDDVDDDTTDCSATCSTPPATAAPSVDVECPQRDPQR